MDDALLNERETARRLGVSQRTLQDWRWRGRGPRFVKLGTAVRYRPADLVVWLDARTCGTTSQRGAA